jgi:hypothetical protein
MSRPSLAAAAIWLALTIYIACRNVMPLWRDRHWLVFDFKVARSSVSALAAQPPISLLSSRHTKDVVPLHNKLGRSQSIVGLTISRARELSAAPP